jgi:hypothetical protein
MLDLTVLDIVISLVFIFLLYSLLGTVIQELIATTFKFRSKILERAIFRMLEDESKFKHRYKSILCLFRKNQNGGKLLPYFYKHPLIKYLGEDSDSNRPSYIHKETFSKVIIDLLRGIFDKDDSANDLSTKKDDINSKIENTLKKGKLSASEKIPISGETLLYLRSLWIDANGNVDKFKVLLEKWFDETMDRATGWYKKNTQIILLAIGFIIALLFNVDTVEIIGKLQKDPKLREQVILQADAFTKAHPNLDDEMKKEKQSNEQLLNESSANTIKLDSNLSKQKALANMDSLSEVKYAQLKKRQDELLNRADSLVKNDIGKVNGIMGVCPSCNQATFSSWHYYTKHFWGWIISALAISLGASFWFDMLNKLMKLRNSISIPTSVSAKKKKEEE